MRWLLRILLLLLAIGIIAGGYLRMTAIPAREPSSETLHYGMLSARPIPRWTICRAAIDDFVAPVAGVGRILSFEKSLAIDRTTTDLFFAVSGAPETEVIYRFDHHQNRLLWKTHRPRKA